MNQIMANTLVTTVLAIGISLTSGQAQTAVPDKNGIYYACYNTADGSIRLVDSEVGWPPFDPPFDPLPWPFLRCSRGQKLISWNQTGPIGPPGPHAPRADGPCYNDNDNRYQLCGNGTVTDTATGLIWLQNATCYYNSNWAASNRFAANLKHGDCGLTDNSSPGDWRLPTKEEWEKTVALAIQLKCMATTLTNTAGTACQGTGASPFYFGFRGGVFYQTYWSSTTHAGSGAWVIRLNGGETFTFSKTNDLEQGVWPVRGGR